MEGSPLMPDRQQYSVAGDSTKNEAPVSGVSWAAVIAGAVVAAALALILVSLGSGLGFAVISPWANTGASAATVGIAAIAWLIATQIIASAMGGYLAGRLRTKWVGVHTDEVFFRDTAHGFLAWGVGVVISAAFLASAASALLGGAAKVGGVAIATAGGAAATSGIASMAKPPDLDSYGYFTDTLLRKDEPGADGNGKSMQEEVGRILANVMKQDEVAATDKDYLAKLVAAKTGVSPADANKRVTETIAQLKRAAAEAKQAADTARKVAAQLSLWTFLALLIGAFCASYAATIGGRQRDHVAV